MKRLAWVIGMLVLAPAAVAATLIWLTTLHRALRRLRRSEEAKESNEPVDPKLIEADVTFGLGLFAQLANADSGKNVFISPASVSLALTMTYNGASGTTKDAMAKALALSGMSLEDVNKANSALLANLEGPGPGVELRIANSLWARKGVPFKDDVHGPQSRVLPRRDQQPGLRQAGRGGLDRLLGAREDQREDRQDRRAGQPAGDPVSHQRGLLQGRVEGQVRREAHPRRRVHDRRRHEEDRQDDEPERRLSATSKSPDCRRSACPTARAG